MRRSRFSESQIVRMLKEAEAGRPVSDVCRENGVSSTTFYVMLKKSANYMRILSTHGSEPMGLGHQGNHKGKMYLAWDDILRSRRHAFYDRLQQILSKSCFEAFAEKLSKLFFSDKSRPSIPPGRYFQMHLVGYSKGIDSERGIGWPCADSLSLRDFLQLSPRECMPDESSLSRTRSRLCLSIPKKVLIWASKVLSKDGLALGGRIGVAASSMEANVGLKTIVRRDTGENYRQMLGRMTKESGMESATDGLLGGI